MAHDISSLDLSAMSNVRSAACVAFCSVYALEAVTAAAAKSNCASDYIRDILLYASHA